MARGRSGENGVELVETVKKNKRKKSWAIPVIFVVLAAAAAAIWWAFFLQRGYDPDARAFVDGRIERGDDLVDQAAAQLEQTSPAPVIRDDDSKTEPRIALVFTGFIGNKEDDTALLELLHTQNIPAAFALSASEGQENEDLLDQIAADKILLLSNGTDGAGNLHTLEPRALVETMLKSRQSLSGAADRTISLFYGSSTQITGSVLRSAAVSGYDAVLAPRTDRVLDEGSFTNREELEKFLDTLTGDAIVVVNLRGRTEAVADETGVTAQKPALDKRSRYRSARRRSGWWTAFSAGG